MSIQRKKFSTEVGGKTFTLEISSLAEQTNASVIAKYGETVVLITAVMAGKDATGLDYMPLKVDYEERFYAAGKIIGSRYVRREGKSSEEAVLSGRLVDRVIRPLFDHRLRREMQVVATVVAIDGENDPDFVGLMGASAALAMSDIPWNGPAAGVRVAKIGDEYIVNPNNSDLAKPDFEFETFVAGVTGKINMVELCGKEIPEKDVIQAFSVAQKEIDQLIEFQNKVIKEVGKEKREVALFEPDAELKAMAEKFLDGKLEKAAYTKIKSEYVANISALIKELAEHLHTNYASAESGKTLDPRAVDALFDDAMDVLVHKNILESDRRPDGRKLDEVRELNGEVGLFERTHGSAVFIRGNTQSLSVTTIAAPGAEQLIETMETNGTRRFMLHYNFPPYSVHEIGNFRGPGRREIGHGALAEKAIKHLIPSREEFPYAIRVVSDILSSNGSSSMATVCAGIMSLMDAGVPIKKMAAGIAMGLMMETQTYADDTQTDAEKGQRKSASSRRESALKYKILTDIQGPEDHYGDIDFKIAGTEDGVTAIQMDTKVTGISVDILEKGLAQARDARLHILKFMKSVISEPRPKISQYAPGIIQLKISPDKIGSVIGPGGKNIRGLIERFKLDDITIDEDGSVFIAGKDMVNAEAARKEIAEATREFHVGDIVEGKIIKIMDFGAIMDLGGGQDGMIHVSELKNGFVKTVDEVLKLDDFVRAKIIKVQEGKIGLSLKQLNS